jgi:hypothetical protein
MSIAEAELQPQVPNQVDQFMADITAYHAALSEKTSEENPDIVVSDLFAWTDPKLHSELRTAIWAKTDGNWSVSPVITDTGEAQLVLHREKNKFHYM